MNKLFVVLILITLSFSCERNHPPTILGITYTPESKSAGTTYSLIADVYDEDGDSLDYLWLANGGEFTSQVTLPDVIWRSPVNGEGQSYSISIEVSDGEFQSSKELIFELTKPILGSISGNVYYAHSKIPIPDVTIRILNKQTITNTDGYYIINDIVAGSDTLRASRQDFTTKELTVVIPENEVLHYDVEMISIPLSTKAYGIVFDQEGNKIFNAKVVLLNPDGSESNLNSLTDENGVYRIQYIPHGERFLIARKEQNENFKYSEVLLNITFTETEEQHNFIIEKIALKGNYIDTRDNREYPFITIGNQIWMAENLVYLPKVNPPGELSDTDPYFYVYGYDGNDTTDAKNLENFRNFGVLYNWEAAKHICPFGWHLPSTLEWNSLINTLAPGEGNKLRTTSGWEDHGDGNNSSGFSAVPAGKLSRDGAFTLINRAAFFQTSSAKSQVTSYYIEIYTGFSSVNKLSEYKREAYSVRCIRNN